MAEILRPIVAIGTILYGYCQGYFGRDGHGDKRIEALGADWVVCRHIIGDYQFGMPTFACARNGDDWNALLSKWATPEGQRKPQHWTFDTSGAPRLVDDE